MRLNHLAAKALVSVLLFAPFNAFADFMSTSELANLATNFIEQHMHVDSDESIKVRLANIQPSINVPVCKTGMKIDYPTNSSPTNVSTLELSCQDQQSWRIYLPVEVSVLKTVIVAKDTIFPHDKITNDKLTFALHDKKRLYNGYYSDPAEIEGKIAARLITAGKVITKKNIKERLLIKRNQNVEIISRNGFIQIKAHGIARTSGRLNDIIKVYNPSSKRTIDAMVLKPGLVEVV